MQVFSHVSVDHIAPLPNSPIIKETLNLYFLNYLTILYKHPLINRHSVHYAE